MAAALAGAAIAAGQAILVDSGSAQQPGTIPPAAPGQVAVASPQALPPPLVEGPAPDLDLVFTAQVIGWIEPCG